MFRWHSTPLRVISARTRTENAINLRSSLSICWRKLFFRTITSDVSRSYELSKLEPPSLSPNHDIYISTSTDPFFNLSLEDWYVSFLELDYVSIKLTQLRNMRISFSKNFMLFDGRLSRRFFLKMFLFVLFYSTVVIRQAIPTFFPIIPTPTDISRFSLCHHRPKSKSVD